MCIFFLSSRPSFTKIIIIIYQYYIPKGKVGHVVKGIPLSRVKDRLSLVRGSLVECPLVSSDLPSRDTVFFFDL